MKTIIEATLAVSMNDNQRRDQVTIISDLLANMQEPRRLTHVLYMSNMSYTQLKKYLDLMLDLGFAEEHTNPHRAFKITENGKTFMNLINGKGKK